MWSHRQDVKTKTVAIIELEFYEKAYKSMYTSS